MAIDPTAREAARGQYRTTTTDWARVAPYIRFRYERARERLPRSGTVFELGAGIGVGLDFLARSRPDLHFVGVDMSPEAVGFGRDHFGSRRNLRLEVIGGLGELESMMDDGAFLVALEVIEHLTNEQLELFKTRLMAKVDGAVFSFPYDQKNIEGTDHLQSFTIFDIFEIFPGFETLFLRRGSIKFIGAWQRQPRAYVRETLKIAGEADSVARICNLGGPREPAPVSQQPASYLARLRALLRR